MKILSQILKFKSVIIKWVLIVLISVATVYGVTLLPEHYRKQGDIRTEARINLTLQSQSDGYRKALELEYKNKAKEYEDRYRKSLNEYKDEMVIAKSDASKYRGMYFNKSRICSSATTNSSKGSSTNGVYEAPTTTELLPEPYATDIGKLTLEADEMLAGYRGLQKIVANSSCFIIK